MAQVDKVRTILEAELRRKLSDTPKKPFMRFANYEFEGQLKKGWDTITVPVSPKITLTDASGNGQPATIRANSLAAITASDRTITSSDLVINKLHQYREKFSDLEEIQTLYSIKGNRIRDLVNGIDTAVETSIITMLDAFFAATAAQTTTIASMSVSTVAKDIMGLRTMLSKKEVPMAADAAVEGWLGKFAGFSIYESNLITPTGTWAPAAYIYAFRAKSYNYVRQLVKAKVTEADDGLYYNILGEVAHGGKVFDQNAEQLVRASVTALA